uniref:Uncharacterized protein n=1 Tax=Arundo donax TaxID=35708 RepID=A0A0A9G0R9_ARUDO
MAGILFCFLLVSVCAMF